MTIHAELNRQYYVYPSSAKLEASWDSLPTRFAGSIESRNAENPSILQLSGGLQFFPGSVGGGVFNVECPVGLPWFPISRILYDCNLISPPGMPEGRSQKMLAQVYYLEPMPSRGGVRSRSFPTCGISPEHVESSGDEVFWLASLTRNQGDKLLDLLTSIANGFELAITRIDCIQKKLREEIAGWWTFEDFSPQWFRIESSEYFLGQQLAFLTYAALAVRRSISGLHAMHLVGAIEGRPNFRKGWSKK